MFISKKDEASEEKSEVKMEKSHVEREKEHVEELKEAINYIKQGKPQEALKCLEEMLPEEIKQGREEAEELGEESAEKEIMKTPQDLKNKIAESLK